MVSYADNAEDVLLVRAFHDRPPGFFVDVGGGSPMLGSIVHNLRALLGWRGLHVEPDPALADELAAHYAGDVVVRTAVGARPGDATFHRLPGSGGLSTLDAAIAARHAAAGHRVEPSPIRVSTLDEVLRTAGVQPRFEVLKVDVEGWEGHVLAGARLEHWRPAVVLVESTEPGSPHRVDRGVHHRLSAAGYRLTLFDGLNRFFVRCGETTVARRLSVPANVFDHFIRHDWYDRMAVAQRPAVRFEAWPE
jgi:FkbM family methyltransferase